MSEAHGDTLANIEAELAKRHLKAFVFRAWEVLEPDTPLVWNWHLDLLCERLEAVTRGEVKRLVINVPPGTMKSLLVSVFWPAWEWASNAGRRVLAASYGERVAARDTLKMRDIILSPWFQKHYNVKLRDDQSTKSWYITDKAGWRIMTTTGGAGTGEHPDILIIDDPHKAGDAKSEVKMSAVTDWYDRTVSTRGATRGTAIVIIMQRLAENDLSEHLLSRLGADGKCQWEHIMLPMRFEPERADLRDPRTEKGELLWPELFPEEKVRRLEIDLGPYGTAGQLQQRPAPEGGGMFKREWFIPVNPMDVPQAAVLCRGWDVAATDGAGDFTVGLLMAYHAGVFYVVDVKRGQWGPARVGAEMALAAMADGKTCRIREEQEPGSAGKTVVLKRSQDLVGWDYAGKPSSKDKEVRARSFRAQCEMGNVRMVRAPWNEAYLRELEVFDAGSFDDQVDASSTAFNELATVGQVRQVSVLWG